MTTLPLPATESIPLTIRPHQLAGSYRDYTARWTPGTESRSAGPEILDERGDVVADESCATPEEGQRWVDAFDFDEFEREQAARQRRKPVTDDPWESDCYRRCGWEG